MNNQDKLRQLRLTLGLSQHDMAQKIGVSEGAVNHFEHYHYPTNGKSKARMKIQSFIDNFNGNLPPSPHHEHVPSGKIAFSFSKGKRYRIFIKSSDNVKTVEADCIFIYLRKEGKHHIFREARGGWTRTYTDAQLLGKHIQEVTNE